ncbi:hypothetical protein ACRCUN_03805 [Mycobacterium sp. LTG2003]
MTDTPDDELSAATAAMREAESLQRRLNAAEAAAKESAERASAAQRQVAAEARDVHKLESFSLTMILSHLKGSHDDAMARETAEHHAAEYEYRTQQARADADQRLVDHLTRQHHALGDVTARYEQALAVKERWLHDHSDPTSVRLIEIAERRGQLTAERTELEQAREAGQQALGDLRSAAERLDSARSWSAYDTWFDGGMIASIVKENRLDDVAVLLRSADSALRRFTTELADVHMAGVQAVELSSFTRVFDVWFDNFFTDVMVRDRIIEAQENVDKAIAGVKRILDDLRQREQGTADELAALKGERADLLHRT